MERGESYRCSGIRFHPVESRCEGIFRLLGEAEAEDARRVHASIVGNVAILARYELSVALKPARIFS